MPIGIDCPRISCRGAIDFEYATWHYERVEYQRSQRKELKAMSTQVVKPRKEATVQVAYKLPRSLVLQIKVEAAKRGMYPAHFVNETMTRAIRPKGGAA
jgi:predicted HicB family RNase H-like nuclease